MASTEWTYSATFRVKDLETAKRINVMLDKELDKILYKEYKQFGDGVYTKDGNLVEEDSLSCPTKHKLFVGENN